jgi:hypothetical protein
MLRPAGRRSICHPAHKLDRPLVEIGFLRVSAPSPRSRASMSKSRHAATRAVPDCFGSDAMPQRIRRTSSGVCSTVKGASEGGERKAALAFFVMSSLPKNLRTQKNTRVTAGEVIGGWSKIVFAYPPAFRCCTGHRQRFQTVKSFEPAGAALRFAGNVRKGKGCPSFLPLTLSFFYLF